MAWYTRTDLRYRGRLIEVTERYGCFHSARIVAGKPLDLTDEDTSRIEKLSLRGKVRKSLDRQAEAISNASFFHSYQCPHCGGTP